MERGIQYYEWDMIEKAVLEFKFVIHNLSSQNEKLDYSQIRLKSRAHHNLAVAYAKKSWYDDAAVEAREAFELFPSDDNRKVMELIQNKIPCPEEDWFHKRQSLSWILGRMGKQTRTSHRIKNPIKIFMI